MALIRRVALLSLHTSPMEQPGSGDAGGMNVYIRGLASALPETGAEVEIFARSTDAIRPAVEHAGPGVRVHNNLAGPQRKVPKEALPELLNSMVSEIQRIRGKQLVALEAQACGTPVVATRVGGLSRAVSNGRTGMLVDGHHAADWADALEALHDDPVMRADMGRAAAVQAQSSGWQRAAAITPASYNTAAQQHSTRLELAAV